MRFSNYFYEMNPTRFIALAFPSLKKNILAIGCLSEFVFQSDFSAMDDFIEKNCGNFLFTTLSYDLKNEFEALSSENKDVFHFPKLLLWRAEVVLEFESREFENADFKVIEGELKAHHQEQIKNYMESHQEIPNLHFENQLSKIEYLNKVSEIQQEIQLGNCYELNFCQQFIAKNIQSLPSKQIVEKLNKLTDAPFSVYLNIENHEVFCFSPERYIQKIGSKLISQPIKGTCKRGESIEEDQILKNQLLADPKERSENIMITDLVRNDLSRIATKNSVHVNELCGLYSFGTVHQLISTISCEVNDSTTFSEILQATFPMGSMTGAPKISAMKLIEKYENFKRGLFSGSIGYISPNGDFDLNVVIRSLIYNKEDKILSASVGGAITINSIPENEYEECQVKMNKILSVFDGN